MTDEPSTSGPSATGPSTPGPSATGPSATGPAAKGPTALVAPMRRVLRTGAIAAALALPVAAMVGYLVAGAPGAWGACVGMGLAVAFFGITVVVALVTARMDPTRLGMWVLGSWLVKVVLLIVVLVPLRGSDSYSRSALFVSLLVGTFGSLLLEARVVTTTRVPYVERDPS